MKIIVTFKLKDGSRMERLVEAESEEVVRDAINEEIGPNSRVDIRSVAEVHGIKGITCLAFWLNDQQHQI